MPENILLIRLKSIGDILFNLPAVHAVRENFQDAKLSFLVSKEHAPLLRGFSDLDEIISLDRAAFRSGSLPAAGRSLFDLLRRLRQGRFTLAIDFQGYGETAFLSWWSGAPERWGSVDRVGRLWTHTHGACRNIRMHPVESYLSLLRQCNLKVNDVRNEFVLPDDALEQAKSVFSANGLGVAKRTLFFQPFTSSPHKNWPLENFLTLARHFRSEGWQVVFGGGPAERAALEPARAAGFFVSAGTPLLVTSGLMKLSALVIGGDTGLLHLAVAMGKRVVMLMYSTAPGQTHPFQHAEWAITPSSGTAVSEISLDQVIAGCQHAVLEVK